MLIFFFHFTGFSFSRFTGFFFLDVPFSFSFCRFAGFSFCRFLFLQVCYFYFCRFFVVIDKINSNTFSETGYYIPRTLHNWNSEITAKIILIKIIIKKYLVFKVCKNCNALSFYSFIYLFILIYLIFHLHSFQKKKKINTRTQKHIIIEAVVHKIYTKEVLLKNVRRETRLLETLLNKLVDLKHPACNFMRK